MYFQDRNARGLRLNKGLLIALLGTSCLAGPALAQQAPPQTPTVSALQEVVVTARRREERLQDVPVSIVAINNDQLNWNMSKLLVLQNFVGEFTLHVSK